MKILTILSISVSIITFYPTLSQTNPYYSLYYHHPLYYNPAFAGSSGKKNSDLLFRYERPGENIFLKAPVRLAFLADGISHSFHGGLGGFLVFDHKDTTSTYVGNLSYAYKFEPIFNSTFRLGGSWTSSMVINEPSNDPFSVKDSISILKTKMKFGAGILYMYKEKLTLGISVNQVLVDFRIKKGFGFYEPTFYNVYCLYDFAIDKNLSLLPSFFIRGTSRGSTLDFNLTAKLADKFFLGVGNSGELVVFSLGLKIGGVKGSLGMTNFPSSLSKGETMGLEIDGNAQY